LVPQLADNQSDERLARVGVMRRITSRPEVGALVGALAVALLFSAIDSDFRSIRGVARVLDPASTLGIMGIAVALLMIGGEFDLSAGAVTGSTGLLMGMLAAEAGWNVWPALLVSFLFAMVVGLINGILVVRTRLPSFIITLATFFALRGINVGVTRLVTNEVRVSGIDDAAGYTLARDFFNTEFVLGETTFRTSTIWWIVLMLIATWVLQRTRYGSWIFAAGGDPTAARSVGVPVDRVKIALFMTTAGAAWLVGTMTALRLRSALASQGVGDEFVYIIAAVTGGCRLTGGYGSVIGASIGALIFGMTRVGIVFAGWDTDWFYSFLGLMLLAAVLLNSFTQRQAERVRVPQVQPGSLDLLEEDQ
jgi:simple sugar transport system permease protein